MSNCKVTQLKKIVDFDTNWAFPDCNSSLNSLMDLKWCTKLRGHMGWKMDDSNPIWVRLQGRSQLSNPSDLPCYYLVSIKMMHSSISDIQLLYKVNHFIIASLFLNWLLNEQFYAIYSFYVPSFVQINHYLSQWWYVCCVYMHHLATMN